MLERGTVCVRRKLLYPFTFISCTGSRVASSRDILFVHLTSYGILDGILEYIGVYVQFLPFMKDG
jgi:hypothetical protein